MYVSAILALLSLLSLPVNALAHATDLFYWPVSSPHPSPLARISYDSSSLKSDLVSYSPPKNTVDDLIRIGLYDSISKQWIGSLTSFDPLTGTVSDHPPTLRLHLGPAGEIYHVALSSAVSNTTEALGIELVSSENGPRPQLNRPVVLGPDGKGPEEVVEKTFFQKYVLSFFVFTQADPTGTGGFFFLSLSWLCRVVQKGNNLVTIPLSYKTLEKKPYGLMGNYLYLMISSLALPQGTQVPVHHPSICDCHQFILPLQEPELKAHGM